MRIYVGEQVFAVSLNGQNIPVAQIGDINSSYVEGTGANWFQHVGFCSLPAKAIGGTSAAECIYIRSTHTDSVIASRDIRSLSVYGAMKAGEVSIYGVGEQGTSQGIIQIKTDGSVLLSTKLGNVDGGNAVSINIQSSSQIDVNAMTINLTGTLVKIGDQSAMPLAHATEVLTALAQCVTLFGAVGAAMIANPVSYTAFAAAVSSAWATAAGGITAVLPTLPTIKTFGT